MDGSGRVTLDEFLDVCLTFFYGSLKSKIMFNPYKSIEQFLPKMNFHLTNHNFKFVTVSYFSSFLCHAPALAGLSSNGSLLKRAAKGAFLAKLEI